MKRTLHLLYGLVLFLLGTVSLAEDVTISRVEAMSHGSKSSIVIRYSGTDRIQFFAIDAADDMLTLDFPGVMSDFDFSQITAQQLSRVEGVLLDPNSPRGIGIHFYTQPNVSYEIFEGEPGALIVYLEDASVQAQVEDEEPAQPEIEEPKVSKTLDRFEIAGRSGQDRLHGVTLDLLDLGGQLTLDIDGEPRISSFALPDPDRYVLDLKGVIFGLEGNGLEVNSPFIHGVRIRQFRVDPEPVTRLVLDLKTDLEVLTEVDQGQVLLRFAPTVSDLAVIASTSRQPDLAEPNSSEPQADETLVVSAPVESQVALTDAAEAPPATQPEVSAVEEIAAPQLVVTQDVQSSVEDREQVEDPDDTLNEWITEDSTTEPETTAATVIEEELIKPDPQIQIASVPEKETETRATKSAPFKVADDVDLKIHSFAEDDESFFGQMKDTPRNHHRADPILVTNQTIAEVLELGETRNLQAEEDMGRSSLFEKVEKFTDGYETIGGGEQKYRGFEIQKIDVKDANVVDLLRFLADQVGFNLYVDPSVQNLKATYSFRNIPWDQAMDIILRNANLDWEFENGVLRVATTKKFKQEAEDRRALQLERELGVPVETVTFPLSYAKVAEVVPIVEQYLSPRGTILQDERTNTLIIEDIPKRMVAIRTLIRRLDTRVPQVSIESRIVETTKRFLRELGIQWGLSAEYSPEAGTQTGVTFPNRVGVGGPRIGSTDPLTNLQGGYAVNYPVIAENPSGIGLSLGNFLDTFQLDISLTTLESDGLGQIISAPKVTTQNNMTAFIKNGQRIPIQTVQRGTVTVRYVDAVLELEVTPHITSEKTIIMDLVVDKSEPDFTRTVLGNPIINVRRAETRVLVKDGGTTVIGGIFVLNEQEASTGVPGVRKVPILKYLFGNQLKSFENQELLIFITPRIIKF